MVLSVLLGGLWLDVDDDRRRWLRRRWRTNDDVHLAVLRLAFFSSSVSPAQQPAAQQSELSTEQTHRWMDFSCVVLCQCHPLYDTNSFLRYRSTYIQRHTRTLRLCHVNTTAIKPICPVVLLAKMNELILFGRSSVVAPERSCAERRRRGR